MRPHGNAYIDASRPSALAICQRCGGMYNKRDLKWQWDWRFGPRLRNLGIQVCPTCLDVPQESGRTLVLPPDPVPVAFPLPEDYAGASNPLSPLGYNVRNAFFPQPPQSLGGNTGNMTLNAGVNAAFDGNRYKRAQYCAALAVSNSSFNTVGKNWNADPSGTSISIASTTATITHTLSSWALYAPNDRGFLGNNAASYFLLGSSNGTTWTTLSSGTTVGGSSEVVTGTSTVATAYAYHQVAIVGDGFTSVAIAQAVLNFSDAFPNDI